MTTTVQTVIQVHPDELRTMIADAVRDALTKEHTDLITYAEICEVYNVAPGTVSRKVNGAHLNIGKAHYNGRLQNAIDRADAERIFKLKK